MPKPKLIKTPEELWNLFTEYVKETKSKPIKKMVFVGKDGAKEYEERERPLTTEGLQSWLFRKGIISTLQDYFGNRDNRYNEYVNICRMIKNEIRQDQIEGGMAMIYNPSITQRLNGLVEKQSTELSGEVSIKQITGMEVK